MQLLLMMSGYPAPVKPGEDQEARIPIILGKLEQLGAQGAPVDPQAQQLIMQHLAQRMELLKQVNPDAHRQFEAAIRQMGAAQQAPSEGAPREPGAEPIVNFER
jgi:hypothetical protein